jgi:hypothetical protein
MLGRSLSDAYASKLKEAVSEANEKEKAEKLQAKLNRGKKSEKDAE